MKFGERITINNKVYIITRFIGSGAFKMAYLGIQKDTMNTVVIFKPVDKNKKYFEKEVSIMRKFGEKLKWACIPGLICPLAISEDTIITNYFSGVDMFRYIEKKMQKGKFTDSIIACKIMYNTLSTMNTFQNHLKMLHLDIKPENLRINENLEVGIIDIGLACDYSVPGDCKIRGQGTAIYTPPEFYMKGLLQNEEYGKIDVWSLGCVFYQLLFLRHPMEYLYYKYQKDFNKDTERMDYIYNVYSEQIESLIKKSMTRNEKYIEYIINPETEVQILKEEEDDIVLNSLKEIVIKMLRIDPHRRISIARALKYTKEIYDWISEKEDNLSELSSDIDASDEVSLETNDTSIKKFFTKDTEESDINVDDMDILFESSGLDESSLNSKDISEYYKLSQFKKKEDDNEPDKLLKNNDKDKDDDTDTEDEKSEESTLSNKIANKMIKWIENETFSNRINDNINRWMKKKREASEEKKKPMINIYNWLKRRKN
jgi:serine/threonine protein kinase